MNTPLVDATQGIERKHNMLSVEDYLSSFWQAWCDQQGLECLSADEMLLVHSLCQRGRTDDDGLPLTLEQESIVRSFIELWEKVL